MQPTGLAWPGLAWPPGGRNSAVPQRNYVGVLIDDSRSMRIADRNGRTRADFIRDSIAVADAQRSPLAPELPTLTESGIAGVELPYWLAAYAPAGTPDPVLQRLHRMLVQACYWALGLEDKIPESGAKVDTVGEFKTLPFRFGGYQKGVKPSDHAMGR